MSRSPHHPKVKLANDGTLLLNFGEYGKEVEVAAISGDGRRILTVRQVGEAQVWDVDSGAQVGTVSPDSPLAGTTGTAPTTLAFKVFIESAALSPDGSLALLGLNDGTAAVFRVADGTRLSVLHPPDETPATRWSVIRAVSFSADGGLALVGFDARRVGVWSPDGGRLIRFLASPLGATLVGPRFARETLVSSVTASPDGRWVFAGCVDGTAWVWELATGRLAFEATEHVEETLALFDEEDEFGWATSGGNVWVCTPGGTPRKLLATGEHWEEVAFGPGGLLARCSSGAVSHWSFTGTRTALSAALERSDIWSYRAASLGFCGPSRYFFPQNQNRLIVSVEGHRTAIDRQPRITWAGFSPNGENVAVAGWSDSIELYASVDGRQVRRFSAPSHIGAVAFSPDGRVLAVGEIGEGGGRYPRRVQVFDVLSGELLHVLEGHEWQISQLAFSPDSRQLASLGDEVIVWNLAKRLVFRQRVAYRVPCDRRGALRVLSNGRLLVVGEGVAQMFERGRLCRSIPTPTRFDSRWCVSRDERYFDVALNQGFFRADLRSGESVEYRPHHPVGDDAARGAGRAGQGSNQRRRLADAAGCLSAPGRRPSGVGAAAFHLCDG